jgi:PAS domain-containing protein
MYGMLIVLVSAYLSSYLGSMDIVKDSLSSIPLPHDFIIISGVYIFGFLIYYFLISKDRNIKNEVAIINENIKKFLSSKEFKIEDKLSIPIIQQTNNLLTQLSDILKEEKENDTKTIEELKKELVIFKDMVNLSHIMIARINQNEKIIKANKNFFKFFGVENEVKFNMKIKALKDVFENNMPDNWLNEYLEQEVEVKILGIKFKMYVAKSSEPLEYVISFINISELEEEKNRLIQQQNYINPYLKTIYAINKTFEITMIRMINYENYAMQLGEGILEVFDEIFAQKIQSLGYEEVFKVQDGIYAVYDFNPNFEQYKKILEERIEVKIGNDIYIFNPIVVLASGVNFEQTKQQILESTFTLLPKRINKFDNELIKIINKAIISQNIFLGYKESNEKNVIFITPLIKDSYNGSIIDRDLVLKVARDFNFYLEMIKELLLNNISFLKDLKIIINVTSKDLLSLTNLKELLSLIKREELNVVFNVEINSKYSQIFPILKSIKSYAQLGFRKVGRGYISFRDIYALKVEYLEIDNSIIDLMKQNPQWKFLLDSIKLIVVAQHTKLLANGFSDNKVIEIKDELKTVFM